MGGEGDGEGPEAKISAELVRIEEDCVHSGKAQFNAAIRWDRYHFWLGVPAVALSAAASAAFFKHIPDIAGMMSVGVAILAGLQTFLKPSERGAAHKSAGDQYLALRNDARVFREIKLAQACNDQTAIDALDEFTKRRNELNRASPQFSSRDFKKAKQGIDAGEATHRIDERK